MDEQTAKQLKEMIQVGQARLEHALETNADYVLPLANEHGSRFVSVGPVTIGCISPEARDLLDVIMDAWDESKKGHPPDYESTIYGFAYWLIRWSGLVQGTPSEDKG